MQPPESEWVDNPPSGWQFKLIINASANIVVIIHAPVAPPVGWLLTDCLAGCCCCSAPLRSGVWVHYWMGYKGLTSVVINQWGVYYLKIVYLFTVFIFCFFSILISH